MRQFQNKYFQNALSNDITVEKNIAVFLNIDTICCCLVTKLCLTLLQPYGL